MNVLSVVVLPVLATLLVVYAAVFSWLLFRTPAAAQERGQAATPRTVADRTPRPVKPSGRRA